MRTKPSGVDLHAHTTASDGSLTPTQLVIKAAGTGLAALAVTDHDTIGGLAEARSAAQSYDIEIVSGVELSVEDSEGRFHLLGLDFNADDNKLKSALAELRASREERNLQMAAKLAELNLPITMDEVRDEANHGDVIARPHFAQAMLKKGLVSSVQDAFDRFLATGKPLYMPKRVLSPQDAIALIHRAGGIAVMAHPGLIPMGDAALAARIHTLGEASKMDGIEAYYSQHTSGQTARFLEIVAANGMVTSAGSDFHGTPKPHVFLGNIMNGAPARMAVLDAIRARPRK